MKKTSPPTESMLLRARKSYSAIFNNKWFILLLLVLVAAGCKKIVEETGLTGVCPTVTSTTPTDTASGISISQRVDATFSKAMNPGSITAATFKLEQGAVALQGTIEYSGMIASFKPATDLLPNTTYTGTISTGAEDPQGNALVTDYVWNFTTGAGPDITAPAVTSTDPQNAATGVALNKRISVSFSKVMDTATISEASFTIENTTQGGTLINGSVAYTGTTAVFTPTADFLPNTTYLGIIYTTAKDLAGNAIRSDYVWNFTTGETADDIAPTVVSTDPVNLATGIAFNSKVAATFSEAMDPASVTATSFTVKQGTTTISGAISYTGMTATFSPAANFTPGTIYTVTITTAAKDLAGNALAGNYVWTFTTGTAADATRPTVVITDPVNAATGVVLGKKIVATFSEAMDPLTITTSTFMLKNGAAVVSGSVIYSGTKATFSPLNNLAPNTTYTGTITTAAKDLAGNAIAGNYVWTFTTGGAPDLTAPTVLSTNPVNLATGVPGNQLITARFSEAMDPLTISILSFTVKQGRANLLGVVAYAGTTATFTPALALASNSVFIATITTAAKDLAGNAIVNNYVWSFTTMQLIIPPSLGSASVFGAFGGSAGITNQGLNTVINNGSIGTTGVSTSVTGFHDGTSGDIYTETPLNVGNVKGRIFTAPPGPGTATSFDVALKALAAATNAYNNISPASMPGGTDPGAGELGGLTLAPGIYMSASSTFKITNGDLTLDAKGDPNAVWVFQMAAGLTVGTPGPAGARSIIMKGGALPKNVFWFVGSSATINGAGGGTMVGNIIASSGVTFSTAGNMVQTVLNGRALSLNASVTMVNTTINVP